MYCDYYASTLQKSVQCGQTDSISNTYQIFYGNSVGFHHVAKYLIKNVFSKMSLESIVKDNGYHYKICIFHEN